MRSVRLAQIPRAVSRRLRANDTSCPLAALTAAATPIVVAPSQEARNASSVARHVVIWVPSTSSTFQQILREAQEEVWLNRIALRLCGLGVGASIAYLIVHSLDCAQVRRYKQFSDKKEAEARAAAEVLPDSLARRLMRKNSRVPVDKAYTFLDAPPLGEGSFGVVHRAIHNTSGIERAVKCIEKNDELDVGMLQREVEALRLMDHPHICRLVEYFETGRHLWIVTELCRGEELCERVLGLPAGLPEADVAGWMQQMLRATLHCHRQAVVHRDLKPENFLFQNDAGAQPAQPHADLLKLIDFGFAVPAARGATGFGASVSSNQHIPAAGTLLYMSPQVLHGEPATVHDDMWSLGVIFHILLTGKFPFSTNEDSRFQELIDSGTLERDVGEHLASLDGSPEAVDLARRLLTVDPKERITAEGALRHPFFAARREVQQHQQQPPWLGAKEICERSARFWTSCRLRRIVIATFAQLLDDSRVEKERARATFVSLDKAGDGRISMRDLEDFLRAAQGGPAAWWAHSWLGGASQLGCWPRSAEVRGIGYSAFMAATLDEAVLSDERLVRAVFELLDADGDGAVSVEDLHRRLGLSHAEADRAIREALRDAGSEFVGSRLDSKDFLRLMQATDGEWRSGFSALVAQP